ncbi:hypothetical protein [Arcobacter sp. F2176]|uniref:hypothetical protein n=1 Tax=Arcobacter sp. F2176 TaxID=2044511 RepID=UPI00100B95BD|nr:hypothetical protein [Arcobacter sp. F2176]RXJ82187.1 hypothetical protein CRU95_04680 [Arcobacter sp. F2176]
MKKNLLYAVLLSLVFVGCNDPKEANKNNFEQVINKYLLEKKDNLVCRYVGDKFPIEDSFGIGAMTYEKYTSYGLLKKETKEKIVKDFFTGKERKEERNNYNLTDRGKKYLTNGKFCFGTPKVEKIINFTEPMSVGGMKITEVNYTYILEDLPEWYKINEPIKRKIGLILMNDGWSYK